jgi:hypothetical protein
MFQQPSMYNTDYYFLSKNNILSIQKSDINSTQKSTYIYQYYSSGYPKQSVSQIQFGATPKYDKIIYTYRSL